jgi:hypothetical protein
MLELINLDKIQIIQGGGVNNFWLEEIPELMAEDVAPEELTEENPLPLSDSEEE